MPQRQEPSQLQEQPPIGPPRRKQDRHRLMVGLGPAGCADPAIRERLVTLVLHRAAASAAAAAVEKAGGGDPIDTSRFEHTPATDSEGVGDAGTRRRPASGPSMLLNPTFFNSPRIREV